jgi:hypothetical protein
MLDKSNTNIEKEENPIANSIVNFQNKLDTDEDNDINIITNNFYKLFSNELPQINSNIDSMIELLSSIKYNLSLIDESKCKELYYKKVRIISQQKKLSNLLIKSYNTYESINQKLK